MGYRHFIITRFNLRIDKSGLSKDKSGNEVLTNEWLEHRISLFRSFCFPAVVNQSEKNFLWLLYFDIATDESIKKSNAQLEKQYPDIIRIIYADGYSDFLKRYCSDVLSLCPDKLSHVITTRLDNDDIIHRDFIKNIQNKFTGQIFTAVNFVKILMLNPERKDRLYIDYIFSNHFISLIEKISPEGIKGCYCRADRQWCDTPTIQIKDKPYCIELISGKNLVNDFRGFPVFRNTDLSDFQISQTISNSIFDIDNLKIWKMSWRKLFKYLVTPKRF
jgi:hypothetical protein